MRKFYQSWKLDEVIPVTQFLKQKKIKKYFNRETAAAVTTLGMLLKENNTIPTTIPICYATGDLAYQDYGLDNIINGSIDDGGTFSTECFIEKGIVAISPLNQFKILQNMPLCFSAIEFGLTGENAVVYNDSTGLRIFAGQIDAPELMLGAGRVDRFGTVEVLFALCRKEELPSMNDQAPDDALEFLKNLEVL